MMSSESKIEKLVSQAVASSDFFSSLGLGQIPSKVEQAPKGLCFSDSTLERSFLVCSGEFEVFAVASNTEEVLITTLKKGDCFGINSLYLDHQGLGAKIRCKKKGVLFSISNEDCKKLLESSMEASCSYKRLCNMKLRFLLGRIAELTVQNSLARLLFYLEKRADSEGEVDEISSKEALAKTLNMSRAALFAGLAKLEEEKIIESKNGKIHLNKEKTSAILDAKGGHR